MKKLEYKELVEPFVYFLFEGTYSQDLIKDDRDYIGYLITNPEKLFNCFEIFAFCSEKDLGYQETKEEVSNYIIASMNNEETILDIQPLKTDFWKQFIAVAEPFCLNEFSPKVGFDYLESLNGVGTDALQYFAVWLNNLEIENGVIQNSEYAKERAEKRIRVWEGKASLDDFKSFELDQLLW